MSFDVGVGKNGKVNNVTSLVLFESPIPRDSTVSLDQNDVIDIIGMILEPFNSML